MVGAGKAHRAGHVANMLARIAEQGLGFAGGVLHSHASHDLRLPVTPPLSGGAAQGPEALLALEPPTGNRLTPVSRANHPAPETRTLSRAPSSACPERNGVPGCHSNTGLEVGAFFALKECQALLKTRLTRPLLKLFHELTGLRVHLLWETPLDLLRPDQQPLVCPTARNRCAGGDNVPPQCRHCQPRRWRDDPQPTCGARRFRGECGLTNFCLAVHTDTNCPLKQVLQARVAEANAPHLPTPPGPPTVARRAFHRAAALLVVIHHDLQATVHNALARAELGQSRRNLKNLECEQTRRRVELHQAIPVVRPAAARPVPGSRAQQHAQAMLDYLHQHYHRPLSLRHVATALQMNPDYLAHLFSLTVGTKFHDYLQELRLAIRQLRAGCVVCEADERLIADGLVLGFHNGLRSCVIMG